MKSGHCGGQVLAMVSAAVMIIPWEAVVAQESAHVRRTQSAREEAFPLTGQSVGRMSDIALSADGLLTGEVYNTAGQPMADLEVALLQGMDLLAITVTDNRGRFRVRGVRGGTYQLATAGHLQPVRAWSPRTAPPAAQPAALIVVGDQVARAQCSCGCGDAIGCGQAVGGGYGLGYPHGMYGNRPLVRWMRANPGIVITGIAAAIAIPVAIAASDDDDRS